jgi:ABC-type uncharacterized transport system involved in gliding motility auxiliary subunit
MRMALPAAGLRRNGSAATTNPTATGTSAARSPSPAASDFLRKPRRPAAAKGEPGESKFIGLRE